MTDEDLIADEDVVVTISGRGYIKRQPVATYRRQHRGGKGIIGHVTREEDAVEHLLVANTHDWALFFTNRGRVFSAKVHRSRTPAARPRASRSSTCPGVQVEAGEVPMATITLPTSPPGTYLVLATRRGIIKKTPLEQFERSARPGIRAITLDDERRARLGRRLDRRATTSSSPRPRARSPGSTRPRSGRWAATPAGVIGIRLARAGRLGRRR